MLDNISGVDFGGGYRRVGQWVEFEGSRSRRLTRLGSPRQGSGSKDDEDATEVRGRTLTGGLLFVQVTRVLGWTLK